MGNKVCKARKRSESKVWKIRAAMEEETGTPAANTRSRKRLRPTEDCLAEEETSGRSLQYTVSVKGKTRSFS